MLHDAGLMVEKEALGVQILREIATLRASFQNYTLYTSLPTLRGAQRATPQSLMAYNEHPSIMSTPTNVDRFDPYVDEEAKDAYREERRQDQVDVGKSGFLTTLQSAYFATSGMLGFGERFSLLFFLVFGGALFAFCLARVIMMAPSNVETLTVPGEWYWYRQPVFKPCVFIHIYLNIIAGVFAIFQFIPMIRRRKIILHRINGYFVLFTLLPAVIAGSIVARRAFGGELNIQAAYYTIGSMIGYAALMGISNVRKTRKHRKWMLRTVSYTSSAITARILAIIARAIISFSSSYYAVWTCDEVSFLLKNETEAESMFPVCVLSPEDDPKKVYVLVHASTHGDPINFGSSMRVSFGMALWLAILIHVVGVEIYIRGTESYQWPPRSLEAVHQYSGENRGKS
ncbi:hypothetical protein FRC08_008086 [Ceratobasidium sp. 394]|nr:hypothetical protein FRC08_008086 [Ceratobasidium sp. 394]KAG9101833.1 hypothetical protein FS749_002727 [Ceratobasidium sp. UAMH 11750]